MGLDGSHGGDVAGIDHCDARSAGRCNEGAVAHDLGSRGEQIRHEETGLHQHRRRRRASRMFLDSSLPVAKRDSSAHASPSGS